MPCRRSPVAGRTRCRQHGGASPTKHGAYRQLPDPRLAARVKAHRADPQLLEHKRIGAWLQALLDALLEGTADPEHLTAEDVARCIAVLAELRRTASDAGRLAAAVSIDPAEAKAAIHMMLSAIMPYVPPESQQAAIDATHRAINAGTRTWGPTDARGALVVVEVPTVPKPIPMPEEVALEIARTLQRMGALEPRRGALESSQ